MSFAPESWKIGTLEGMFRRAYVVCSDESDRNMEISFLCDVFKNINGYPQKVIDKCHNKIKQQFSSPKPTQQPPTTELKSDKDQETEKRPFMVLPYAGSRGEKVLKKLQRKMPKKIRPKVIYNGTKLGSYFSVKDKIETLHCSNIVYYYKGSTADNNDYTGETKCRLGKRVKEHQGGDKESAIVKNFREKDIDPPLSTDFSILARNYTNRMKRKIAESLFVKEKKSSLNIQKDTYKLQLFI